MVERLGEHWRAFWRSGPDNLYTFIWWAIFGLVVAGMLAIGSLLLGIAKGAEPYFIGGFIALLICVIAAWLTRYRLIQSANEQSRQAAQAQPTQPELSTTIHSTEAETQNIAVGPPMPIPLSAHLLPETNSSQRQETETASRYFNLFNPQRPMIDLPDDRWVALGTLFTIQNKQLRLKFLPDTQNKEEDTLLLLLYGYRQIFDLRKVEARKLEQGLRLSGCRKQLPPLTGLAAWQETVTGVTRDDRIEIDELAKSYELRGKISEKFGLASGGLYSLIEDAIPEIEKLFTDLVRRA